MMFFLLQEPGRQLEESGGARHGHNDNDNNSNSENDDNDNNDNNSNTDNNNDNDNNNATNNKHSSNMGVPAIAMFLLQVPAAPPAAAPP